MRAKNVIDEPFALQVAESGGSELFKDIYIGLANPGTSTSSASWMISKVSISGTKTFFKDINKTWASGNNYMDKVWDDHLTSPYS